MIRIVIWIIFAYIFLHPLYAQSDDQSEEILLEGIESDVEESELLEYLQWLQDHPYDLNTVGAKELESIPGLTPAGAAAIIRYRRTVGKFSSSSELLLVPDLPEDVARKLTPLVMVSSNHEELHTEIRSRTGRDVQRRRGYEDGTFLGSPLKSYLRLTTKTDEIVDVGLLFEKDAGERTENAFVSGYVLARDIGFISHIIAGDYVLEAGQGLVFWSGRSFGKSSDPSIGLKKSSAEIHPHRSTDEFNFFRGLAMTIPAQTFLGEVEVTVAYSRRRLAGSVDASGTVTGFDEAGLTRTASELEKRDRIGESLLGGGLKLSSGSGWRLGATFSRASFDRKISLHAPYGFVGTNMTVAGIDAELMLGRVTAFGEVAQSPGGTKAGIVGAGVGLGEKGMALLLYRDFAAGYTNLHASGFGERDDVNNERGFYIGIRLKPMRQVTVSAYIDHFRFPVNTSLVPFPSSGRDVLLQVDASPNSRIDIIARYSMKSTETSESVTDDLGREARLIGETTRHRLRVTALYQIGPKLRLKTRIEGNVFRNCCSASQERGILLYQDVQLSTESGLTIDARLIFFHTDSYDSRVYEYENDLRGVFSNPALHGKGRRWYILAKYKITPEIFFSVKYSETQKEGVNSISSGFNEISGNIDNRITAQIDVRL